MQTPATWLDALAMLQTRHAVGVPASGSRQLMRFELAGPAAVLQLECQEVLGQVINVSEDGVGLELRQAVRPGDVTKLHLFGTHFEFRIVWCLKHWDGQYQAGLQLWPAPSDC